MSTKLPKNLLTVQANQKFLSEVKHCELLKLHDMQEGLFKESIKEAVKILSRPEMCEFSNHIMKERFDTAIVEDNLFGREGGRRVIGESVTKKIKKESEWLIERDRSSTPLRREYGAGNRAATKYHKGEEYKEVLIHGKVPLELRVQAIDTDSEVYAYEGRHL